MDRTDSAFIAERLRRTTEELKIVEQLIVSGDFSPRILSEFRNAVDSVRQTAHVVQMWTGLQKQHRDPYSAMSVLSEDRVRRATQIAKDLTVDLQSLEVDFSTEGIAELFHAIEALHERLLRLFPAGSRRS
jgi:multidrug resistance efflux pump